MKKGDSHSAAHIDERHENGTIRPVRDDRAEVSATKEGEIIKKAAYHASKG